MYLIDYDTINLTFECKMLHNRVKQCFNFPYMLGSLPLYCLEYLKTKLSTSVSDAFIYAIPWYLY